MVGDRRVLVAPAALMALVPLVHGRQGVMRHLPPKGLLIAILVPAGLAVAARLGRLASDRLVAVAWGGVLAALVAATIASPAPVVAIAGTSERHLGLVAWLLFAGACWLG